MVKEQIPAFILNSGARTEATRMRLTPREGYIMSSHYPLEVRDLSCSLAPHAHSQRLDQAVPSLVVLPSSQTNHTCIACSLNRILPYFPSIPLVPIVRQNNVVIDLSPTLQQRQRWCPCHHKQ